MSEVCFPIELFRDDFLHVYEPTDDTYLLIEAIKRDLKIIQQKINPTVCMEIGCGSGAVITSIAKCLGPNRVYIGTDINFKALQCTQKCGKVNGVEGGVQLVKTDLVEAVADRLMCAVDLLFFNPPFMPSAPEEVGIDNVRCAWSGGINGRAITDRFLPLVPKLLSPSGVLYLIVNELNDTKQIEDELRQMDFNVNRVKKGTSNIDRCAGNLVVFRVTKLNLEE